MGKHFKHGLILSVLIISMSCSKNNNTDSSNSAAPAANENAANTNSNECQNKNEAIINWRTTCKTTSAIGGASNANAETWCSCMESKYDVSTFSKNKLCIYTNPNELFSRLWHDDEVIVQCGTANKPTGK